MRDSMPRCRLSDRNHCALVCFASRFSSVMFCLRPFATVTYDRLPTVCEPASLHSYNQDLPSQVQARIACRQTPTMQAKIDPGLRTGLLFHPGCDGLHIHRQAYTHTQTPLAIETGGSGLGPIHTAKQCVTTIEFIDVELSPLS